MIQYISSPYNGFFSETEILYRCFHCLAMTSLVTTSKNLLKPFILQFLILALKYVWQTEFWKELNILFSSVRHLFKHILPNSEILLHSLWKWEHVRSIYRLATISLYCVLRRYCICNIRIDVWYCKYKNLRHIFCMDADKILQDANNMKYYLLISLRLLSACSRFKYNLFYFKSNLINSWNYNFSFY